MINDKEYTMIFSGSELFTIYVQLHLACKRVQPEEIERIEDILEKIARVDEFKFEGDQN